jgi:hypothetical protein
MLTLMNYIFQTFFNTCIMNCITYYSTERPQIHYE